VTQSSRDRVFESAIKELWSIIDDELCIADEVDSEIESLNLEIKKLNSVKDKALERANLFSDYCSLISESLLDDESPLEDDYTHNLHTKKHLI